MEEVRDYRRANSDSYNYNWLLKIPPAFQHPFEVTHEAMLVERGEYADAELLLIGLLREYPESAELYGRYSRLMLRALHLEKAEQLAREGLRYDPEDNECLMAAALCETARGGARPNAGLQKLLVAHPESMMSGLVIESTACAI